MLYRRKVLLALLQALGGEMQKIDFQKHLFLFTRSQREPSFHFFPYKYGCYSLQAEADRTVLIDQGKLSNSDAWIRSSKTDFVGSLRDSDRQALAHHVSKHRHDSGRELISYVYRNYPYYAINSTIAREYLTTVEYQSVLQAIPSVRDAALFTIGYEGKSIEEYLNQLIEHNISTLCDVRKNPFSRKYGFSQRALKSAVERVGIQYLHFPGLGIPSAKRKSLETQRDYDLLFNEYEEEILPECDAELNSIQTLLKSGKRVALTCFELRPRQCHRGRVAIRLTEDAKCQYSLRHL